jgi:hypothetical protein
MKKIFVIVAVAFGLFLTACSADGYTDLSMKTLRYEKGSTQGGQFVECVNPGEKIVTNDALYPYPTTQRENVWDSDQFGKGSQSADHADLEVLDKNGVVVFFKVKVPFFLNTDCSPVTVNGKKYPGGTLQVFHEMIGKTRQAYFNEDGSYGNGWLWAMDNYISSSVVDYLKREARVYTAEQLYNDPAVREQLQTGLVAAMPDLVNATMETDLEFYKFPKTSVKIYDVRPEDEYLAIFKERQAAEERAATAEINREAKVAEAKANAEIAEAQAKVKRAEIEGYGGFENWNKSKAVENGLNPYQPTYVVGGTGR